MDKFIYFFLKKNEKIRKMVERSYIRLALQHRQHSSQGQKLHPEEEAAEHNLTILANEGQQGKMPLKGHNLYLLQDRKIADRNLLTNLQTNKQGNQPMWALSLMAVDDETYTYSQICTAQFLDNMNTLVHSTSKKETQKSE